MILRRFRFPFFVAGRYLFSKKTHTIINIVSGISVLGVSVGTMALIVVLSVFNGFESLVVSLFNSFNPDIQVSASEGKTFHMQDFPSGAIRKLPGVVYFSEVVEENALLKYKERQTIVTLKGVGPNYGRQTNLDSLMYEGSFILQRLGENYAVVGYGVAYFLDLRINDFLNPVQVYVPKRTNKSLGDLSDAFNNKSLMATGVFTIQQEFDSKYAMVPLEFAREMLDYKDEATSVEISLSKGTDVSEVQDAVKKILGDRYQVKNRFQQQELLYKIMKSEKWAIFLILSFILLVATFNVIGSLTMLILDKRKDITVLWSMGADNYTIRRIFVAEGMMITLTGAVLGLVLGAVLCFLQHHYGLIRLNAAQGAFLVNVYPVKMKILDFLVIFMTVMIIGIIATWLPVKRISKRHLEKRVLT